MSYGEFGVALCAMDTPVNIQHVQINDICIHMHVIYLHMHLVCLHKTPSSCSLLMRFKFGGYGLVRRLLGLLWLLK